MKKLLIILAVLCLSCVITGSSAMAFTLGDYSGMLKFKFNDWDYGTLYGPTDNAPDGVSSGSTDSYGIFTVTSITDLLGNNLWSQTAGEALEGWFYGLSDDGQVIDGNFSGNIWSTGGKLEMYLGPRNLNPTTGPGAVPALGSAPAIDLWNAADGSLFLSADFVPGITADATTTYLQDIDSLTSPISGSGIGYLKVTGGSAASMFDSNLFAGGADFLLQNDYRSGTLDDPSYGWTVVSHDPVLGSNAVVPEPTTMLLFGMGVVGMLIRKKKVA